MCRRGGSKQDGDGTEGRDTPRTGVEWTESENCDGTDGVVTETGSQCTPTLIPVPVVTTVNPPPGHPPRSRSARRGTLTTDVLEDPWSA